MGIRSKSEAKAPQKTRFYGDTEVSAPKGFSDFHEYLIFATLLNSHDLRNQVATKSRDGTILA
jgi:hypothetical protein